MSLSGSDTLFHNIEQHEQTKALIDSYLADRRQIVFGRVVKYDAVLHLVRVQIAPEMNLSGPKLVTGWVPLLVPWGGNGWGVKGCPIVNKAHVLLIKLGHPVGASFAIGPFHNLTNRPTVEGEEGEWLVKHQSGSRVMLKNDGSIEMLHSSGAKIELDSGGNVVIDTDGSATVDCATCELKASGEVNIKGGTVNVSGDMINLN